MTSYERYDTPVIEFMMPLCVGVFKNYGNKVMTGPFKGMQVPCRAVWDDGNTVHKLIGCYEHELHASIEKAIARQPKAIVNVGCCEGYYSIGLARRLPEATVYAIDLDERSLALLGVYAHKNGVMPQMRLMEGALEAKELDLGGEEHHLYVMDCEGHETVLLDPKLCPILLRSDIIVECHNFLDPDISVRIADSFATTHDIELFKDEPPVLCEKFVNQPMFMQVLLATDIRPHGGCWLACWAKSHAS
jgi:hypothetical protein